MPQKESPSSKPMSMPETGNVDGAIFLQGGIKGLNDHNFVHNNEEIE